MLHKTIESLLSNANGEIEVIPVIDGYELKKSLIDDRRVKPVYLSEHVGMREAINIGVNNSTGEYLMRTDEHCMFSKGFDTTILSTIEDNWIVVPRRYYLDIDKWEVMGDKKYVDYEKLLIIDHPRYGNKFAGIIWKSRTTERKDIMIDETMAMQGSCWFMKRSWWDKVIGRLDSEGYGTLYQDSTEMIMKTWQAGGKMMLNKNAWYAHKNRSFARTHRYSDNKSKASFAHAIKVWGDYYKKEILPKWKV
jgi:glycosyltransferase involved in cell wall biosynthesis